MRQRANKRARPQPPGFFTGSRGCGCCQPPPPPPPPRSPYGYYYRRGDIQRSPCDWFCQNADGDFTGELPAYRWYFEVDSFENVTFVPSPCQSATSSLCDNSNGTFAIQYLISGYTKTQNQYGTFDTEYSCVYESMRFQSAYKSPDLYPLLDCAICTTIGLGWVMELFRRDSYDQDGNLTTTTGAGLRLTSDFGQVATGALHIALYSTRGKFNCSSNNTFYLDRADWGYGVYPWHFDGPQCCTGAPNAIEIVPL